MADSRHQPDRRSLLSDALQAIEQLQQKLKEAESGQRDPIAVVGMGCRWPGSINDPDAFWTLLSEGREAVSEVPNQRWNVDDHYDPDPEAAGKMYTRKAGFIDQVDQFDPQFFGISPREAKSLDPQQRLMLEVSWEALERAGQSPSKLKGSRTGVFVGIGSSDYAQSRLLSQPLDEIDAYAGTGGGNCFAAGRLSYILGLQGPSLAVDTACSSSLVAVHLACQSLRTRECNMALAGGVHLSLSPWISVYLSRTSALSPDGRSKVFDYRADGFARGEGCGVVVLKRLADAQRSNDRILAVIRGTATNQDGASSGLTVPNGIAQRQVIRDALANAGVQPGQVGYVEAHGTGTSLGDPIEISALTAVLQEGRAPENKLVLGATKASIGHAEAAAGIAGLMKTILCLQHKEFPPQLNFQRLNPQADLHGMSLVIPTRLADWNAIMGSRIAGVSSFGMSGTNAHVILEQATEGGTGEAAATTPSAGLVREPRPKVDRPYHLLTLSTKEQASLGPLVSRYEHHLANHRSQQLGDVCYTAAVGRTHFGNRIAILGSSSDEVLGGLKSVGTGELQQNVFKSADECQALKLTFIFPGHGEVLPSAGLQLYESQPSFRQSLQQCDELMQANLGGSILSVWNAMAESRELPTDPEKSFLSKEMLRFAVQWALARLWRSWGIEPSRVMGTGTGELVAACVSGVVRLEDAIRLVDKDAVNANAEIEFASPKLDFACAKTGRVHQDSDVCNVGYWLERPSHLVDRFASDDRDLPGGFRIVLGAGPHTQQQDGGEDKPATLYSLSSEGEDWKQILTTLAMLYVHGVNIDWDGFDRGWSRNRIVLPTYPFNRTKHWLERQTALTSAAANESTNPLLGRQLRSPRLEDYVFEARFSKARIPLLDDHRIHGQMVVPGTAYLEMALSASRAISFVRPCIKDVTILAPLILEDNETFIVQTILTRPEAGRSTFQICSIRDSAEVESNNWTVHVCGEVVTASADESKACMETLREDSLSRCTSTLSGADYYRKVDETDVGFGPAFRGVLELSVGKGVAVGEIKLPAGTSDLENCQIHPALLDAGLQVLGATLLEEPAAAGNSYAPISFDSCEVFVDAVECGYVCAELEPVEAPIVETFAGSLHILDQNGALVARLSGICFKKTSQSAPRIAASLEIPKWFYELHWSVSERAKENSNQEGGSKSWLILADRQGHGALLGRKLESLGHHCLLAYSESKCASSPETAITLDVQDSESFDRLIRDFSASCGQGNWGVVHLWTLDADSSVETSQAMLAGGTFGCASLCSLVQATSDAASSLSPEILVVTCGAQATGPDDPVTSLSGAPLWGLARVIPNEHPDSHCRLIDLDPQAEVEERVENLVDCLRGGDEVETQLAIRQDRRLVPRLQPSSPAHDRLQVLPATTFQLDVSERGLLDNLYFAPAQTPDPARGELQIRVSATGLNFRDVLNALGMYPGDPGPLGNECVGEVVKVGSGVKQFKPGDQVIALTSRGFCSLVNIPYQLAFAKPAGMSIEQAATLPIAFLTAEYALRHVGRMQAGERVLIHAAAGGVGLAAVQIAQAVGAEIYATAGSPRKREYLKSLGVSHVMNSRTLEFADDILTMTNGEGVDLVLNSLAGDFISRGLAIMRPGGRFLEIGKIDLRDQDEIAQLHPDVEYLPIQLGDLLQTNPALIETMFNDLLASFESHKLRPLPHRTFPIADAKSAFRFMSKAQHIGKIVISQNNDSSSKIRTDATYLITGGLGAIGMCVAEWMAASGARHLVLVSRSEPSQSAQQRIELLEAQGVEVIVGRADVCDARQLDEVLESIRTTQPQLRGVIHAAGVVDDRIIMQEEAGHIDKILAPKIAGSWNLHKLTRDDDLDFFVLFSSSASLLGSPGQGAYSAANSFLDSLALHRSATGLPAQSIDWGPWADVGMAADVDNRWREAWARQGIRLIKPEQGTRALEELLERQTSQVAVLPVDWKKLAAEIPSGVVPPVLRELTAQSSNGKVPESDSALLDSLRRAHPADLPELIAAHIQEVALKVLGLDPSSKIQRNVALRELGLDSLMAVELSNQLKKSVSRTISATVAFEHPTIDLMARYVAQECIDLGIVDARGDKAEAAAEQEDNKNLSADEARLLLAEELQDAGF